MERAIYNPYVVSQWTDEQIKDEVSKVMDMVNDGDTLTDLANNLECYTRLWFLFGEMKTRMDAKHIRLKGEVNANENKAMYTLRSNWTGEKMSIDYFKAQAYFLVKDQKNEVNKAEEQYNRFKTAYEVYGEMINVVKKKMEAMKFEDYGNR